MHQMGPTGHRIMWAGLCYCRSLSFSLITDRTGQSSNSTQLSHWLGAKKMSRGQVRHATSLHGRNTLVQKALGLSNLPGQSHFFHTQSRNHLIFSLGNQHYVLGIPADEHVAMTCLHQEVDRNCTSELPSCMEPILQLAKGQPGAGLCFRLPLQKNLTLCRLEARSANIANS